jgi:phosphotransferase system enzyme I (PtsI)
MAAGREDKNVAHYYNKGIELVLGHIRNIAGTARALGKECCICGELGADANWTEKLIKAGIRHFSVSPHEIPRIKNRVGQVSAGR